MGTNNNSGGRGRSLPVHEVPSMPVFLCAARSREQLQVVASGPVARELELYTDRASGVAMMPDDEVLVREIDHALTECFRYDTKIVVRALLSRACASSREGERPWS